MAETKLSAAEKADFIRSFLRSEKERYNKAGNGPASRAILDLLYETDGATFAKLYDIVRDA